MNNEMKLEDVLSSLGVNKSELTEQETRELDSIHDIGMSRPDRDTGH